MMNCTTSRVDDNNLYGKPIPVSEDNYPWELKFRTNIRTVFRANAR